MLNMKAFEIAEQVGVSSDSATAVIQEALRGLPDSSLTGALTGATIIVK